MGSSCLGLFALPAPVCLFPSPGYGRFPSLFFHVGFNSLLSLVSFWHPHDANVGALEVVPEASYAILTFWILFLFAVLIGCFLLPYLPNL